MILVKGSRERSYPHFRQREFIKNANGMSCLFGIPELKGKNRRAAELLFGKYFIFDLEAL
ncbi:MAG: hypothetical protein LBE38_03665 [Deltaproteobacteria bacterium]|nr:hypothetical protein [Deltaproteobacteria bacterium]